MISDSDPGPIPTIDRRLTKFVSAGRVPMDRLVPPTNPGPIIPAVHPDDRMVSTLDDTYTALGDAISAVTDLAILCGRHLPTSLTRKAERALAVLCELRDAVTPPAGESSPF